MQNNFKPLKEIINIHHGYAFESSFFSTEKTDFILLTPGNFGKDQKLHFGEKTKFYNANPPEDYVLNNGDLLVVMTDLTPSMEILGNCVQLESDTKILHNQRIGKIEFLSEKVDSLYLLYTLNSNNFRKFIKNTASGTTVRHTSPSRILENTILLPPLPEQKKIAAILSTWDRAIEGT